jgi:TP901 family phage tail tape measure protein
MTDAAATLTLAVDTKFATEQIGNLATQLTIAESSLGTLQGMLNKLDGFASLTKEISQFKTENASLKTQVDQLNAELVKVGKSAADMGNVVKASAASSAQSFKQVVTDASSASKAVDSAAASYKQFALAVRQVEQQSKSDTIFAAEQKRMHLAKIAQFDAEIAKIWAAHEAYQAYVRAQNLAAVGGARSSSATSLTGQMSADAKAALASLTAVNTELIAMKVYYDQVGASSTMANGMREYGRFQAQVMSLGDSFRLLTQEQNATLPGLREYYQNLERMDGAISKAQAAESRWQATQSQRIQAAVAGLTAENAEIKSLTAHYQQLEAQQAAAARARSVGSVGTLGGFATATNTDTMKSYNVEAAAAAQLLAQRNRELADTADTVAPKIKKAAEETRYLHDTARGAAAGVGYLWMTWGNIGAMAAGFAGVRTMQASLKQMVDIEKELTLSAQAGGGSVEDLNERLMGMFGGDSPMLHNAGELAEALKNLTLAGFSTDDAFQMLGATYKFAAAGEMELADAAQGVQQTMNSFRLPMSEVGMVTDVLAKAAAASATTIGDMVQAMKTGSVVGAQYNVSIKDFAMSAALLGKVGITGQAAGTAIKNFYTELSSPKSKKAAEYMEQLGLEFYEMEGNVKKLKPLHGIIDELRTKFRSLAGVDQQAFLQSLNAIFNERGIKEAAQLIKMTEEEYSKLQKMVLDSSGFVDELYSKLSATTQGIYKDVGTQGLAAITKAIQEADPAIKSLGLALRELVTSEQFAEFFKMMVSGFTELTKLIVEHGKEIAIAVSAYAGFKLTVGILSSVGSAIKLLSWTSFIAEVGVAKTGVVAVSEAVGVTGGAAGLAARLAAFGALGAKVFAVTAALYVGAKAYKLLLEEMFGTERVASWEKSVLASLNTIGQKIRELSNQERPWWAKPAEAGGLGPGGASVTINKMMESSKFNTPKLPVGNLSPESQKGRLGVRDVLGLDDPMLTYGQKKGSGVFPQGNKNYSREPGVSDATGLYPPAPVLPTKSGKTKAPKANPAQGLLDNMEDYLVKADGVVAANGELTASEAKLIQSATDYEQLINKLQASKAKDAASQLKAAQSKSSEVAASLGKLSVMAAEERQMKDMAAATKSYTEQSDLKIKSIDSEADKYRALVAAQASAGEIGEYTSQALIEASLRQQVTDTIEQQVSAMDVLDKEVRALGSTDEARTAELVKEMTTRMQATEALRNNTEATLANNKAKLAADGQKYLEKMDKELVKLNATTASAMRKMKVDVIAVELSERDALALDLRTEAEERYASALDVHAAHLKSLREEHDRLDEVIRNSQEGSEQFKAARAQLAELDKLLPQVADRYRNLGTAAKQAGKDAASMSDAVLNAKYLKRDIGEMIGVFETGFKDMLSGGEDAWKKFTKNLRDTFKKQVIDQIYRQFLQEPIRALVTATVTGVSSLVSGVASAAGGGGGTGAVGSLSAVSGFKTAYDAFATSITGMYDTATLYIAELAESVGFSAQASTTIGSSAGAWGGAAAGVMYGYEKAGVAGAVGGGLVGYGAAGAATSMLAGGTAAEGIAATLGGIGPWGWVALAVIAILGGGKASTPHIGLSKEFDTEGGSEFLNLKDDLNKDKAGWMFASGQDPTQEKFEPISSAIDLMGKGILDSLKSGVAGLGGEMADAFKFSVGFAADNDDPSGGLGRVRLGDDVLLDYFKRYAKKADEGFKEMTADIVPRITLLAYQTATGLSPAVDALLDTVDAATASTKEINDLLTLAQAWQATAGFVIADPVKQAMEQIEYAGRSALKTWQDGNVALTSALASFDGTLASAQQLGAMTQAQYQMELNLIGQIQGMISSSSSMFDSSIKDIKMSVMDDPQKYDFLRTEVDSLYAQLTTAFDPTVISTLSQQINDLTKQAYGMLGDEQKQGAAGEYVTYLEEVGALTEERLNAAQAQIVDQHKAMAQVIEASMQKVADQMMAAAQVQQAAAAAALAAANTRQQFDINLLSRDYEVGQG